MNQCINCHRPLKGQLSIKRGMGRRCFIRVFGKQLRRKKTESITGQDWEQIGLFEGVEL